MAARPLGLSTGQARGSQSEDEEDDFDDFDEDEDEDDVEGVELLELDVEASEDDFEGVSDEPDAPEEAAGVDDVDAARLSVR